MHSSEINHPHGCTPQQIDRLKELLACSEITFLTKSGGGNSKVLGVLADGEHLAVKSYPPHQSTQRDRLAAEVTAYQFLNQQKVGSVPLLKGYCERERWLIMSWIEGVLPSEYSSRDILQAMQFIRAIAQLNSLPEAIASLPQAAEACLSLNILINQIKRRFQRLISLPEQDPLLMNFLTTEFEPLFKHYQKQAIEGYAKHQIDPEEELPLVQRSLIPADFGFHNAIRDTNGQLYFFDFDYFGWDDPVKLLADILWHPKMQFSMEQEQLIIRELADIYKNDATFLTRFCYTCPLFGLRWVLILLNEFIAEYWQNRQHAEVHTNQQTAKKIQLERAKGFLTRVANVNERYLVGSLSRLLNKTVS